MRFQFDPNQDFQLEAIAAVVDLFDGQRRHDREIAFRLGGLPAVPNRLDLRDDDLLRNLRAVQKRVFDPLEVDPLYAGDAELKWIAGQTETADGPTAVRFANFSVEMETGTGKTYVYLRTALELHRRYGFRKFIVVVPSVAIREGVLKTLQMTRDHFRDLYDNVPYRFSAYDSANLSQVRQFALADSVEFMIMTLPRSTSATSTSSISPPTGCRGPRLSTWCRRRAPSSFWTSRRTWRASCRRCRWPTCTPFSPCATAPPTGIPTTSSTA